MSKTNGQFAGSRIMQSSYDGIRCPICVAIFEEPKSLSCSHTFCRTCLECLLQTSVDTEKVPCPVCEQITCVPGGDVSSLPTDTTLRKMADDARNRSQTCTLCEPSLRTAVSYCRQCGEYMCEACQSSHSEWKKVSRHRVIKITDIPPGSARPRKGKCVKHPAEDEELFCVQCGRYVCFKCGVMEHERREKHYLIQGAEHEIKTQEKGKSIISLAEVKNIAVNKFIDYVRTRRQNLELLQKRLINEIDIAFDDMVRTLSERRVTLVNEIRSQVKELDQELSVVEERSKQQVTRVKVIGELINKGLDFPLEKEAFVAHKILCRKMTDIIGTDDPDYRNVDEIMKTGEKLKFRRSGMAGLDIGDIVEETECWRLENEVELPNENSMSDMTVTPERTLAVTCSPGGIEIYRYPYGGCYGNYHRNDQRVEDAFATAFLSDGRLVVREISNNISMYPSDGDKIDVKFKTLALAEGGQGGVSVDTEDQIYLNYRKVKKIQIFRPSGGKAVRAITCGDSDPIRAFPLATQGRIVVKSGNNTVHLIDNSGNLIQAIYKENIQAYPAPLYGSDEIIVAWVSCLEGLVSIDHYTSDLRRIRTLVSAQEVQKSKRQWYSVQRCGDQEIAFCSTSRLYIFKQVHAVQTLPLLPPAAVLDESKFGIEFDWNC